MLARGCLLGILATASLVFCQITGANAQVQSEEQERCINALNRNAAKLARVQGTEVVRCVTRAAKGRLDGTIEVCLSADGRGKVARAKERVTTRWIKTCLGARPDFGVTDAGAVNAVHSREPIDLLRDIFGTDLDEGITPEALDRKASECQAGVAKSVSRCERTYIREFDRCVRNGLARGSMDDATEVSACIGDDPERKIAKACGAVTGAIAGVIAKRCAARGVDLSGALPGCGSGDPASTAQCLERMTACRACLALNRSVFLDRDCDDLDDGSSNGSCVGLDRYGGWTGIESTANGRFRVEEIGGVWWLITPDGHGFYSAGVNHVTPNGDFAPDLGTAPYHDNILARYGSEEGWRATTIERLRSWNFTTIGAWSTQGIFGMPYTLISDFSQEAPAVPGWPSGVTGKKMRDYFAREFETNSAARAGDPTGRAALCASDPLCVGLFTDNELGWGPSAFQFGTFLDAYMTLPAGAPGKLALQAHFEDRYAGDIAAFNESWGESLVSFDDLQQLDVLGIHSLFCDSAQQLADRRTFTGLAARRYYQVVHDALRALYPHMLILGSRFGSNAISPELAAAVAPYVDVVSLNNYEFDQAGRATFAGTGGTYYDFLFLDDSFTDLETLHELTGKPLMITEYTYRTPTPGAVTYPPFMPTVDTQDERADETERYLGEILSRPYMVGTHWFEYIDQPVEGRSDGENSRFGLVNIEDDVYAELTERHTRVNGAMYGRPWGPPVASMTRSGELSATSGVLGERSFTIAAPTGLRTGFFIYLLPDANLSLGVSGDPLVIEGGAVEENGVAPLTLTQDALVGLTTLAGDSVCLRFTAEGSFGSIACDGGFGHDVIVSRNEGESPPPAVFQNFQGTDSGPGAATLLVPTEIAELPAGSTFDDCLTATYQPQQLMTLSTATVTTIKGPNQFDKAGENFVCGTDGADWRLPDGPGMFVLGYPTFDSRLPGGELASAFGFADREIICE